MVPPRLSIVLRYLFLLALCSLFIDALNLLNSLSLFIVVLPTPASTREGNFRWFSFQFSLAFCWCAWKPCLLFSTEFNLVPGLTSFIINALDFHIQKSGKDLYGILSSLIYFCVSVFLPHRSWELKCSVGLVPSQLSPALLMFSFFKVRVLRRGNVCDHWYTYMFLLCSHTDDFATASAPIKKSKHIDIAAVLSGQRPPSKK